MIYIYSKIYKILFRRDCGTSTKSRLIVYDSWSWWNPASTRITSYGRALDWYAPAKESTFQNPIILIILYLPWRFIEFSDNPARVQTDTAMSRPRWVSLFCVFHPSIISSYKGSIIPAWPIAKIWRHFTLYMVAVNEVHGKSTNGAPIDIFMPKWFMNMNIITLVAQQKVLSQTD